MIGPIFLVVWEAGEKCCDNLLITPPRQNGSFHAHPSPYLSIFVLLPIQIYIRNPNIVKVACFGYFRKVGGGLVEDGSADDEDNDR